MNEYESALVAGIMTLIRALNSLGVDRITLAGQFRESANESTRQGHESSAAVSNLFARIAEADNSFIPNAPFHVIKGGKESGDP
jgi:hypothetical protein